MQVILDHLGAPIGDDVERDTILITTSNIIKMLIGPTVVMHWNSNA